LTSGFKLSKYIFSTGFEISKKTFEFCSSTSIYNKSKIFFYTKEKASIIF
jgi:hypothetical protein